MVGTGSITWCQQHQPQTISRPLNNRSELGNGHGMDKTQLLAAHIFARVFDKTPQRKLRWDWESSIQRKGKGVHGREQQPRRRWLGGHGASRR